MISWRHLAFVLACACCVVVQAQGRRKDDQVSSTVKGDLVLPVSLKNPIYNSVTETVGQLGATFQIPISKGFGLGLGGNVTWSSLNERALAPYVSSGDVRRYVAYGKVQYEQYTSDRTFYELSLRVGMAAYDFDCATCIGQTDPMLYWSLSTGYYIHATDNLAFGLLIGYDNQAGNFSASDLGLTEFPGRKETSEAHVYQNLLFGLGFSTRLRRSERDPMSW